MQVEGVSTIGQRQRQCLPTRCDPWSHQIYLILAGWSIFITSKFVLLFISTHRSFHFHIFRANLLTELKLAMLSLSWWTTASSCCIKFHTRRHIGHASFHKRRKMVHHDMVNRQHPPGKTVNNCRYQWALVTKGRDMPIQHLLQTVYCFLYIGSLQLC